MSLLKRLSLCPAATFRTLCKICQAQPVVLPKCFTVKKIVGLIELIDAISCVYPELIKKVNIVAICFLPNLSRGPPFGSQEDFLNLLKSVFAKHF